jgi:hypothetical protein
VPPDASTRRERGTAVPPFARRSSTTNTFFAVHESRPRFAPGRPRGIPSAGYSLTVYWRWRKPTDGLFPGQYLAGTRSHCVPARGEWLITRNPKIFS